MDISSVKVTPNHFKPDFYLSIYVEKLEHCFTILVILEKALQKIEKEDEVQPCYYRKNEIKKIREAIMHIRKQHEELDNLWSKRFKAVEEGKAEYDLPLPTMHI
jgi:hypothetical protein